MFVVYQSMQTLGGTHVCSKLNYCTYVQCIPCLGEETLSQNRAIFDFACVCASEVRHNIVFYWVGMQSSCLVLLKVVVQSQRYLIEWRENGILDWNNRQAANGVFQLISLSGILPSNDVFQLSSLSLFLVSQCRSWNFSWLALLDLEVSRHILCLFPDTLQGSTYTLQRSTICVLHICSVCVVILPDSYCIWTTPG